MTDDSSNTPDNLGGQGQASKKLLENPFVGSLVVPIAIVLVGALIIFGVTNMLSTDQSYKDLVREMQSKKFGNRWIAAYELSKLISTDNIPAEDVPWLVGELKSLYSSSQDPRTKEFIIVAAGALRTQEVIPLLISGLDETDGKIKFHSIVALGNMPKSITIVWDKVLPFIQSEDQTIKIATILATATHRVAEAQPLIKQNLASKTKSIKYTAATALIHFKDEAAISTLDEIMSLSGGDAKQKFDLNQIKQLKLNVIYGYERENWNALRPIIEKIAQDKGDVEIMTKARNVLNKLKN